MKTSKHQFTGKLMVGVLSFIILLGTTNLHAANGKDPVKKETKAEQEVIASLKKSFEFTSALPEEDTKKYKIYDANDNLIHEVSLNKEIKGQDRKLVKYLLIADFVMEYDNTEYYRIN